MSAIVVSDLDGTLTTAEAWRGILAWVQANHPSAAADRFVKVRLPLVLIARAGLWPKEAFRARWLHDLGGLFRGLPADRLPEMGEWVVETALWPARRTGSVELVSQAIASARRADPAARLVIASGAYEAVVEAWARRMGADVALGTPLEVVDGRLTGRLAAEVQTGERKAGLVRDLAAGAPVVAAFGDTGADIPFLRLAGRAVAVAPDKMLRAEAGRSGWEIVETA